MTTDFRALCVELTDCLEKADWPHKQKHVFEQWLYIARKALAEPEPEGPTYDDLAELCSQHGLDVDSWSLEKFDALWEIARTVLARWGRPAPQPVPVSERLPGPEDCDAEGRCWWGEPQIGDSHDATWTLCTHEDAQEFLTRGINGGWLPAHALPVPQ